MTCPIFLASHEVGLDLSDEIIVQVMVYYIKLDVLNSLFWPLYGILFAFLTAETTNKKEEFIIFLYLLCRFVKTGDVLAIIDTVYVLDTVFLTSAQSIFNK